MRAGKLRHKVAIQNPAQTPGAQGLTETWSTAETTWASVEPLTAREQLQAAGAEARVTHKIFMRYGNPTEHKSRILYAGRYFYVLSVMNKGERNRELEILAEERI